MGNINRQTYRDMEAVGSICDEWRREYLVRRKYQRAKDKENSYSLLREISEQGEIIEIFDDTGTVLGALPVRLVFMCKYLKENLQSSDYQILRTGSFDNVPSVDIGCLKRAVISQMDYRLLARWNSYADSLGRGIKEFGLVEALRDEVLILTLECC